MVLLLLLLPVAAADDDDGLGVCPNRPALRRHPSTF